MNAHRLEMPAKSVDGVLTDRVRLSWHPVSRAMAISPNWISVGRFAITHPGREDDQHIVPCRNGSEVTSGAVGRWTFVAILSGRTSRRRHPLFQIFVEMDMSVESLRIRAKH